MKWLLGTALALAVSFGGPALGAPSGGSLILVAQRGDDTQQQGRGARSGQNRGGTQGATTQRGPRGQAGTQGTGQGAGQRGTGAQAGTRGPGPGPGDRGRGQVGRDRGPGPGPGDRGRVFGRDRDRGEFRDRGPGPGFRDHGPRNFDRRAFNRNFRAPQRFRAGIYRPLPGWRYRRYAYGEFLPPMFWGENYWIVEFWLYGLDRPPEGCNWVRYGNDAMLIDMVTGEVLQVAYDVFY